MFYPTFLTSTLVIGYLKQLWSDSVYQFLVMHILHCLTYHFKRIRAVLSRTDTENNQNVLLQSVPHLRFSSYPRGLSQRAVKYYIVKNQLEIGMIRQCKLPCNSHKTLKAYMIPWLYGFLSSTTPSYGYLISPS